ncbi:hypothetical protein DPEC_G00056430 [Dallia pectoralis]|uniref:Uncharacterized protein n=1 Tax=Dallia pectoralis TaxID=75939 RepID=A0ACC2H5Y1_DALPE|nr:hypothetical protein DPEC_G00056430 [Dallia pectoralis]
MSWVKEQQDATSWRPDDNWISALSPPSFSVAERKQVWLYAERKRCGRAVRQDLPGWVGLRRPPQALASPSVVSGSNAGGTQTHLIERPDARSAQRPPSRRHSLPAALRSSEPPKFQHSCPPAAITRPLSAQAVSGCVPPG